MSFLHSRDAVPPPKQYRSAGNGCDATLGKKKDSVEIKMYQALRPAMNETLKRFSGGEELDSAEAWKAWLAENVTKKWPEFEQ